MIIPSQLTWADLGDTYDGPHATPQRVTSGPYFLNISSLSDGRLDLAQSDHVSSEEFAKWTRRVTPQADDLLFSYETRLGEAALMPDGINACLGRRMALLRPNRDLVHPRFMLYYYLSPAFQQIIEQNTIYGATVNRISLSTIGKWPVTIPSLKEQQAVAEVLGALDDKIAANTKLSRTIDQFLAAYYSCITRNSPTVPLGEIASVNPETCKPLIGGSLRYIDISSVGQGFYEFPEISSWDDAPSRARRPVRCGDTLWSTVRPNRRSHALNLSSDELLVGSTGLAVLRPCGIGYSYLYESTKTPEFSAYLENVAEGSAYPAVRANRFEDAPISWPKSAARESFEMTADPLRKMQHSNEVENQYLAALRDALLPQLMSGKLRVKDAEALVESVV